MAALLWPGVAAAESPAPNIVLILTDDQGWTGTSVQLDDRVPDSRSDFYHTPALERLASEGMRFSNAYAPHPNCSPTRVSIQTGKSPAQMHMTDIIGRNQGVLYEDNRLIPPQHISDIPAAELTIAELIKAARPEYSTGHFGKWHLGGGGPGEHGYDESDGPTANREGNVPEPNPKRIFGVTQRASAFMTDHAAAGQPFFLQISHYAVHLRIHALASTIEKYQSLVPGPRHNHPGHAAMTKNLDTGIGMVLEKIDELGIGDNTYVIMTSDNGSYLKAGATPVTTNLPLAGQKASVWEGGIRVPMFVRGPGIAPGSICHVPVIGWDLYPTIRDLLGIETPLPEGVEGGSLRELLKHNGAGRVARPREELVWHFPHYQHKKGTKPQSAIRLGDYKLIEFYETGEVRLFDLAGDLGETRDLSAEMPEKAAEMHARLRAYLAAIDAPMPAVNPDYGNAKPVCAASFRETAAAGGIVSLFGSGLTGASGNGATAGEVEVRVLDTQGSNRKGKVLFASSGQVNFVVPPLTAAGTTRVRVSYGGQTTGLGDLPVEPVAPGLFAANANGSGVAAAVVEHRPGDGSRSLELTFECSAGPGNCTAVPVDLGPDSERVFLWLFGTGIRNRASLSDVRVTIGGEEAEVLYAGQQAEFDGLDQVNAGIPRTLAGRGEVPVSLSVAARQANTVTVNIR